MSARLENKAFIVTGGSSGIGFAVARRLTAEGAAVVIGSRRKDVGEAAAESLRTAGGTAIFVPADVTIEDDAARLVTAAVAEFGRLDGAFNNAGGVNASGPISTVDADTWNAELTQNVTSVFHCLKYQVGTERV